MNPKQLEGLRLLLTPFPQQQFNATDDRRSLKPSQGVACFDCHVNGHTNASTHLVGDIRPQEFRHRLDTPSLRGVNIQRLFGSQRALKSVEDFTEFEQRAAYFDGDPVIATKKGVNILERGSQVHFMAEFQELFDFPPAPKLTIYGKLDPQKAGVPECADKAYSSARATAACAIRPRITRTTRCTICKRSGSSSRRWSTAAWLRPTARSRRSRYAASRTRRPICTTAGCLTLEDTVEFFNLVLETKLSEQEKQDLTAFMRCL